MAERLVRGSGRGLGSRLGNPLGNPSNSYQYLLLVLLGGTGGPGSTTPLDADGAPQALRSSTAGVVTEAISRWGPAVVAVAAGVAVVAVVVSGWSRRRALARRDVGRLLLPSPKFDPSIEEVERFAAVLARSHRATRMPGSRASHAVRVRIGTGLDGLVEYRLEGHHRTRSVLTLAGFDQVDNQPLDDGPTP